MLSILQVIFRLKSTTAAASHFALQDRATIVTKRKLPLHPLLFKNEMKNANSGWLVGFFFILVRSRIRGGGGRGSVNSLSSIVLILLLCYWVWVIRFCYHFHFQTPFLNGYEGEHNHDYLPGGEGDFIEIHMKWCSTPSMATPTAVANGVANFKFITFNFFKMLVLTFSAFENFSEN